MRFYRLNRVFARKNLHFPATVLHTDNLHQSLKYRRMQYRPYVFLQVKRLNVVYAQSYRIRACRFPAKTELFRFYPDIQVQFPNTLF